MRALALAILCTGLLFADAPPLVAGDAAGHVVIAGNGPEAGMIEKLARAFEKANPRAYVDILWNENSKPLELVKNGQAQIAVTGKEEPTLRASQIGWDGIAIMVNLSNHTKEITAQQVAQLFSGKIKMWSELGGPDTRVLLLDRPRNRNIRDTFEQQLGIAGQIPESAKVIKADDKVIKTVVGTLPPLSAVTYVSLGPALEAVASGVAVRLLQVDKVEPEEPTVKDGRYKLRRPVLLLSTHDPNPTVDAFVAFTLSPDGQKIVDAEGYTPLEQKK
jgi:phosphate transport system substrate-binding protein